MWTRVSVVLSVALLSVTVLALVPAPARAGAQSGRVVVKPPVPDAVQDPAGDVSTPPGDILGSGFAQSPTSFVFGVKVKSPVDPATNAEWLNGIASIRWGLDVDNDGAPDYVVFLVSDLDGGLLATLGSVAVMTPPCIGRGALVAGYGYTATFPTKCLPTGLKFQFRVQMSFSADEVPFADFAPDPGFGPVLETAPTPVKPIKPPPAPSTKPAVAASGYWMLGADGHVYPFGGAVGFPGLVANAVALAPRTDGRGYWLADATGHVFAHGTAVFHGGSPALRLRERVTTIAATASGNGYWLFSDEGRAFAFGDAHSYGDLSGTHLNGPIIASAATPSGKGYYMVGTDGGIFAFGDARFHGSTGNLRLNEPIVGMAPTPNGGGYWLVGSDGGVFAFNAPFRGSMGAMRLNQPVDGLVAYGNGYLMAAADGGVFDFSNRAFAGSLAAHPPPAPIVGLAAFAIGV
jgi:hypothetical protein